MLNLKNNKDILGWKKILESCEESNNVYYRNFITAGKDLQKIHLSSFAPK